jgi:D-inositol-3-phosphate glycosyltransferase
VHANFFMSGMVAQHLKQALGMPFVITFHALGQVRRLAQGAADTFPPGAHPHRNRLMRQADRIIAECAQDRLDMEQLYGAAPARIAVAPCGFDPGRTVAGAARRMRAHALGLAPGKLHRPAAGAHGAAQGRRHRDPGAGHAARAAPGRRRAAGRRRRGATRAIPTGRSWRACARSRGSASPPMCALPASKPRAELRLWYNAADVFVTTPWYEPFGITPVEAMACARPVIGPKSAASRAPWSTAAPAS